MQNVVLYNGSAADREIIRDHEFRYKAILGSKGRAARPATDQYKFNVLLASYEMLRKDRRVFQVLTYLSDSSRLCILAHTRCSSSAVTPGQLCFIVALKTPDGCENMLQFIFFAVVQLRIQLLDSQRLVQ